MMIFLGCRFAKGGFVCCFSPRGGASDDRWGVVRLIGIPLNALAIEVSG